MQYNYINAIRKMRSKLELQRYPSYSKEILDAQLSGFMASEIIGNVGAKLLEIKRKNKEVYVLIKEEIEAFIVYANSIGIYPK